MTDLLCPKCKELYSFEVVPKILNCGHTICNKCVQKLVKFDPPTICSVTCPFDRITSPTRFGSATDFPDNEQIVEAVKASSGPPPPARCGINDAHLATCQCKCCPTKFCDACFEEYHLPPRWPHDKDALGDDPKYPCPVHPNFGIGYVCQRSYCRAEYVTGCGECFCFGPHVGHQNVYIRSEINPEVNGPLTLSVTYPEGIIITFPNPPPKNYDNPIRLVPHECIRPIPIEIPLSPPSFGTRIRRFFNRIF